MTLRLPAKDAADLIEQAKIPGIDHVYVDAIPVGLQDSSDSTDVLVTEVTDLMQDYGSDLPTQRVQTIALNIFYSTSVDVDTASIEQKIEAVFLSNNWSLVESLRHTTDPDTLQTTKIYQFQRKERNDINV